MMKEPGGFAKIDYRTPAKPRIQSLAHGALTRKKRDISEAIEPREFIHFKMLASRRS